MNASDSIPESNDPAPEKKDVSVSLGRVNVLAIPMAFLPILVVGLPYLLLWGIQPIRVGVHQFFWPVSFIPALLFGIIFHELLHGIGWVWFGGKQWSVIKFGFKFSALSPYAHCTVPLAARAYKLGTFLPGLVLGVIPSFVALFSGSCWMLIFGVLFLVAAAGDFLVLWIIRNVRADQMVEDHPTRAGCYVFERSDSA